MTFIWELMMWPRVFQLVLGIWLAISPFIFGYGPLDRFDWFNTLICAAVVVVLSLLAVGASSPLTSGRLVPSRLARIYLLTLVVGLWLFGAGFLAEPSPPPPAHQNYVVVGLLLLMFGILPSPAHQPPPAWQAFHR